MYLTSFTDLKCLKLSEQKTLLEIGTKKHTLSEQTNIVQLKKKTKTETNVNKTFIILRIWNRTGGKTTITVNKRKIKTWLCIASHVMLAFLFFFNWTMFVCADDVLFLSTNFHKSFFCSLNFRQKFKSGVGVSALTHGTLLFTVTWARFLPWGPMLILPLSPHALLSVLCTRPGLANW